MRLTATGVLAVAAIAAAGLGVFLLWRNRELFNPVSDQNLAYKAASAALGDGDSLGGRIAEIFSPTVRAANRAMAAPVGKSPAKSTLAPINDNYVGDFPLDDSPGFVSSEGGAAVGMVRKMR